MDSTWLHHSLAGPNNDHDPAPLHATDTARFSYSLASRDNGRRSAPRGRLHVARPGDSHESTPLLFTTNSWAAHCQTVTNIAISLLLPLPIKGGPQIRFSLSSIFYPKTLLKFLFEHSILVEVEN